MLFIGNSVDDENVCISTSDEPNVSKGPIGEDDVWIEEVKPSLWSFQYNHHFVRIERDVRKIEADSEEKDEGSSWKHTSTYEKFCYR